MQMTTILIFANDCFHMMVSSFFWNFDTDFSIAHFLESLKWDCQDGWVGKSTWLCNIVDFSSIRRTHVKVPDKKENRLYKVVLWPPHACCDEHEHTQWGAKRVNIDWLIKPLSNLDCFLTFSYIFILCVYI